MSFSKKNYCKGRCLFELRDWRYSLTVGIFDPGLWMMNYCPSNLLSGSPPPPFPLPCVKIQYIQAVCCWLWGWGEGVESCERPYSADLTFCIWSDSESKILLDHPKQKLRRGGGLRQIKTCRKVPLQVNIFILVGFGRACAHPSFWAH